MSFLESFNTEFRAFQKKSVTFSKDLWETTTTYSSPTNFVWILFSKPWGVDVIWNSSGAIVSTKSIAKLYIELDVSLKKGDIVIDQGREYIVDDIVSIPVFWWVIDHKQAYLSYNE